jgi:hypothetical protein
VADGNIRIDHGLLDELGLKITPNQKETNGSCNMNLGICTTPLQHSDYFDEREEENSENVK